MGRGRLTENEIQLLYENPYVSTVQGNRIVFTDEFKKYFIEEYINGKKGPTQIFREAGFDIAVLGTKRIERAAARWKESYASGTLGTYPAIGKTVEEQQIQKIKNLKTENALLKKQIELLKNMSVLKEE